MTDFLFDGGWITNAGLLFVTIGYTIVGLGFGYVWGESRAERRSYKREDEAREYWRSYYSHPSNR